MAQRYALAESDDDFLMTAARRYVHNVDIGADPAAVWAALTADDALVSWSPVISAMEWTAPRPFGVGATRTVTLGGVVRLDERFYRWDEGKRMTFTVDAASIPGLRRFAEDIVLAPRTEGTRLTWTFALEGTPALRPLLALASPANRLVTSTIANGTARVRTLHGRTR
ncbi:SRPBCC family protein [Nocardia sp. NBC_00508]|uniref:SRPBCC family protein n=1 Tax=Nocardia sp. NBC_00508 TaxID=2975992 RepID=UPI002E818029|nr:SRPBCC family protein [Nocardia sp. NBC_00508]WUD66191.1 SRPBCC family protein [Nocardia sp. NBC_00508]